MKKLPLHKIRSCSVSSVIVPSLSIMLKDRGAKLRKENRANFWEYFFQLGKLIEILCFYDTTTVFRDEENPGYLPYQRYHWKSLYLAELDPIYDGLHLNRLEHISDKTRDSLEKEIVNGLEGVTIDSSPYIPVGLLQNPDFVKTTGYKRPFDKVEYFNKYMPIPEVYLSLVLERTLNLEFQASFCDMGRYFEAIDINQKIRTYDLLQSAYSLLVEGEKVKHDRRFKKYGGMEEVFVPPLLSVILKRIDDLSQFWDEVLYWRQQFEPFREKRCLINEMARSDDPSSKVDKEIDKIEQSIQAFISQYIDKYSHLETKIPDVADIKLSAEDMELNSDLRISSMSNYLLSKGISFLRNKVRLSRIKPLPLLKSELDLIGRHSSIIEKLWDTELDDEDLKIIPRVLNPVPCIGDEISCVHEKNKSQNT